MPEYHTEPNKRFQVASTEDVRLLDGTQAQLRYMIPVGEVVNYGPYWEGTFHKGEYIYTLSVFLGQNGKKITKQTLSTMATGSAIRCNTGQGREKKPP